MDKAAFLKLLDDEDVAKKLKSLLGSTPVVSKKVATVVDMTHRCSWLIKSSKDGSVKQCEKPGETQIAGEWYCGVLMGKDGKPTGHTRYQNARHEKEKKSDTKSITSAGDVTKSGTEVTTASLPPARSGAGGPPTEPLGGGAAAGGSKKPPTFSIPLISKEKLSWKRYKGTDLYMSDQAPHYLMKPATKAVVGKFAGKGKPIASLSDTEKRHIESLGFALDTGTGDGTKADEEEDKMSDYADSADGGEVDS